MAQCALPYSAVNPTLNGTCGAHLAASTLVGLDAPIGCDLRCCTLSASLLPGLKHRWHGSSLHYASAAGAVAAAGTLQCQHQLCYYRYALHVAAVCCVPSGDPLVLQGLLLLLLLGLPVTHKF
jgi:hypothetical protein